MDNGLIMRPRAMWSPRISRPRVKPSIARPRRSAGDRALTRATVTSHQAAQLASQAANSAPAGQIRGDGGGQHGEREPGVPGQVRVDQNQDVKVTEEQQGVFVAVLDMPPTPSEMGQLAGMLPADAFCVDAEQETTPCTRRGSSRVWPA